MLSGVHAIADGLVLLHGWRRLAVAFLAGTLSVLAMPPLFAAPVLWLTLPALVLLLDGADADPTPSKTGRWISRLIRPSFAVGWWFGFGYFLAGLYWIGEALLVDAAAHGWLIPFCANIDPRRISAVHRTALRDRWAFLEHRLSSCRHARLPSRDL
jgi:apolipoprotein N-acyltransferase